MKNWTIGKRITAGFASMIIIAIALGVFAFSRLITINTHSEELAKVSLPTVEIIGNVQKNAVDYSRIIYQHIGSSDKGDMAQLEKTLEADTAANTKNYEELSKFVVDPKVAELLQKSKEARAAFAEVRDRVLALSRQATNNEAAYNLGRHEMDPASDKYMASIQNLNDYIHKNAEASSQGIQSAVESAEFGILTSLCLACLVGSALAFLITRGTGKILGNVTTSLDEGSSQVANAAGEITTSSQSLAEGASEQAASLEETSSSLEEMSSMTKRNAENAQKANELAKQARQAADKGVGDMQTMSTAMEAIKVSSDDIAKIIKTIDEIAFQTNILALNAAVEAARAGEAGMGFAVVADEVRNLAQRSAQAAKETAGKIEGAIAKTGQGVEISSTVAETLNDIATKVRQVDELVAEVASASREQTQGISQINTAVSQMDKVTQSTAASAEESAAAAEELRSQAEIMKSSVIKLLELVGGAGQKASVQAPALRPKEVRKTAPVIKRSAPAPVKKYGNGNGHAAPAPAVVLSSETRGSIPMEGDFTAF